MGLLPQQPKTLVSLAQSEIVSPPSLIEPSILTPGGQLILASQAKTGKSFMMLELGRALASADQPFESPVLYCPRACRVLLIEQELGEAGLKKRTDKIYTPEEIQRQGFMANNFMYLSQVPDMMLDTQLGVKLLYQAINSAQPDVLMLDPLGRFHNLNENDNQEVGKLFSVLDKLKRDFPGMALLTSYHMSKPPDQRAGFDLLDPYRMNGAAKFYNNPDTIITTLRTHDLDTIGHKAWAVKMRITLRHGEPPDDMILHFNQDNDSRVRHHYQAPTKPLAAPSNGWPNKKQEPATQEGFGFRQAQ